MVAQGGAGGPTGHTECKTETIHYSNLGNGASGSPGQGGIQGIAGAAAPSDPGQFGYAQPGGDLMWVGNHGGRGGDGSAGAGGGGGAAGDNGNVYFWCGVGVPIRGGAGHNGNWGGCGGGGGDGGSSGGGAFAVVVADTTVDSAGLVLFGGTGGSGGGGGSSASGTSGESDGTSGSGGESTGKQCVSSAGPIVAGTGGAGGSGGQGGGGGGGAGGNGGPSVQLVTLADGALTMDANATVRYAGGRAGTGGTGGTGVQDNNAGPPGNGGVSADQMSIPLVYVVASASSSASNSPPSYAVDGNPDTAWNSGWIAPAWIELDLKHTVTLAKVRLLVAQDPAGPTTHQLYFGPTPAPTALIATLSQSTKDMQWLDVDLSGTTPTGRYLRVSTTASPSWVAWREIVAVLQPQSQQLVSGRRD